MSFMYQNDSKGFDLDRAIAIAPTLAAETPHGSRSHRYAMVPTKAILQGMFAHGFQLHGISTANVRDQSKVGFEKHMLRFRRPSDGFNDTVNEVIVINSHDGSTCFQMRAGMYRFVCSNGMIVGDDIANVKIKHSGEIVQDVIEGAEHVVATFERVTESRERMKGITLYKDEQRALAEAILPIRFDVDHYRDAPISPDRLLIARRHEDRGDSLWNTFNVIQENLIKGGISGSSIGSNGRRRRMTTRTVNGIDQNVKLNQALHTLATRMADLKEAA